MVGHRRERKRTWKLPWYLGFAVESCNLLVLGSHEIMFLLTYTITESTMYSYPKTETRIPQYRHSSMWKSVNNRSLRDPRVCGDDN